MWGQQTQTASVRCRHRQLPRTPCLASGDFASEIGLWRSCCLIDAGRAFQSRKQSLVFDCIPSHDQTLIAPSSSSIFSVNSIDCHWILFHRHFLLRPRKVHFSFRPATSDAEQEQPAWVRPTFSIPPNILQSQLDSVPQYQLGRIHSRCRPRERKRRRHRRRCQLWMVAKLLSAEPLREHLRRP